MITTKKPSCKTYKHVKEWLILPEEQRPCLIPFYLFEPNHARHSFGPESDQASHLI